MINESYIKKYLTNELTAEECRELAAWVKADKQNSDFLFSLKDTYHRINYPRDKENADTEQEWQKLKEKIAQAAQNTPITCRRKIIPTAKRHLCMYAAALAVVCIVIGWHIRSFSTTEHSLHGAIKLKTGIGQQAQATLPDGSTVLLNACSELICRMNEWETVRNVQLNGEAIFHVTHDRHRPFHVHTRQYRIQVYGTKFNVIAYGEDTESVVTLEEGKVKVYSTNERDTVTLRPQESFVYNNLSHTYGIEQRSLNHLYALERREILLDGHTLEMKKEELSRHFGYTFTIAEELKNVTYRATLRDESLHEFLSVLSDITPQLTYRIDPSCRTVILQRNNGTGSDQTGKPVSRFARNGSGI
ncbi:FecR domain-containing protein [Tannerella forsythia]|uniref:FecR family protein n=1 Tax=Tannerella forsythia TaxID=28112 RepID=UPI0028DCA379|nr:FecR domain-containing protein [Tannerella forsythia]